MLIKTPEFWRQRHWLAIFTLKPLALLYTAIQRKRMEAVEPTRLAAPILCIGNLVAGGAGKTPVALSIGTYLKSQGVNIHFLTRGYGGRLEGPVRVNPEEHGAHHVGDEALLLAQVASTWVAEDRLAGAQAAEEAGAQCIIMDDGHQNPSIVKDMSIVVIDGEYGFGNGEVLPLGPLREPLEPGLERADAAIIMGEDTYGVASYLPSDLPVYHARLAADNTHEMEGIKVVAFAGIGRPQKFFDTLIKGGAHIMATRSYADHYRYSHYDIEQLQRLAFIHNAILVTTTKDHARIPRKMKNKVHALAIHVAWEEIHGDTPSLLELIKARL